MLAEIRAIKKRSIKKRLRIALCVLQCFAFKLEYAENCLRSQTALRKPHRNGSMHFPNQRLLCPVRLPTGITVYGSVARTRPRAPLYLRTSPTPINAKVLALVLVHTRACGMLTNRMSGRQNDGPQVRGVAGEFRAGAWAAARGREQTEKDSDGSALRG